MPSARSEAGAAFLCRLKATVPCRILMDAVIERADVARLHLRLRGDQKRLIERAASLSGRSLTDFVVDAVTARAAEVVEEHSRWVLSDEAFDAFVAALDDPPPPNEALRRLMAE